MRRVRETIVAVEKQQMLYTFENVFLVIDIQLATLLCYVLICGLFCPTVLFHIIS